jgi:GTP-binding protein
MKVIESQHPDLVKKYLALEAAVSKPGLSVAEQNALQRKMWLEDYFPLLCADPEKGRALVLAVNKWDQLDEYRRSLVKRELERKLHFLDWAKLHFISAQKRSGLGALMRSVESAHRAAFAKMPTPKLTRALRAAVERQQPPRAGHSRPKMRYAHQGGHNPPVIVVHGNSLTHIQPAYRRYLEGWFRREFSLAGTPLRIEFRTSTNPYAGPREGR